MIKGFFFDLDGTLVNTYQADYLAYRDAIAEVTGIVVDEAAFAATHGQEMREKLKALTPGISDDDMDKVGQAKRLHYSKYLHLTEANEKLVQLLGMFADHHSLVLVTTAKKGNALAVLERHKLTGYFTDMVFGDEVNKPKPDPDPYLIALKKTGLKASEVIAFEDSESGIASAESAGIAVIKIREFAQ